MRKLSLLLCLALLVTMFVGCGGKSDDKTQNTVSNETFSTADVNFLDANNKATYLVVRPEESSPDMNALGVLLFKQYTKAHGVSVKNISDSADGTDKYEILIGDTNRPESAQAKQWLLQNDGGRYQDYIICTIGKKIVINAFSEEILETAVQYFIDNYLQTPTIKGGIKYISLTEGNFSEITVNGTSIRNFSIVRPHLNSSYLTYVEVEKLVEQIAATTGFRLPLNDDTVTSEAEYEIIIGNCDRPNVKKISNRDEYSITVSGKKIYINGGSHQATTVAVTELINTLGKKSALTDADTIAGSYSTTVATYDSSTYYTPTFYDDFDDITGDNVTINGLNSDKWILNTSSTTGKNGYKATRATDPDHVYVADGLFQIHPYFDYGTNTYYGGFLETGGKMKFTYGYIEYSAKIPDGPGFWTALWLRCNDYSGSSRPEIDIAESFGNSKTYAFNMHTWPGNEAGIYGVTHTSLDGGNKYSDKKKYCPDNKKFNDDFHTYGMLWTPEIVYATCDGVPYFKYNMGDKETDAWCFGKLMKICISEAVGFEACEGDPLTASDEVWENNAVYLVDWCYVYQLDDGIQKMVFGDEAK